MTLSGEQLPGCQGSQLQRDGSVYPPPGERVTKCHARSIDVTTEDLASALDVTEEVIDQFCRRCRGGYLMVI